MKKIIAIFAAVLLLFSIRADMFAEEAGEEYHMIKVEYSDNTGHPEDLQIMIRNDNVFADAKTLAERLGYSLKEGDSCVVIYNNDISKDLPMSLTQFNFNSTQISHAIFTKIIDTYEAPFASIRNDKGIWIPLEYSLLLLNSGMMITENALLIDIPAKSIIDRFFDIIKNSGLYTFDWADDFGYTDSNVNVIGGSSHLVNVFNGLLEFDSDSWSELFQSTVTFNPDAYDGKYGEMLAILLCTESDKEIQATKNEVETILDLLAEDGQLGDILSAVSTSLDKEVGELNKTCESLLKEVKNGNTALVEYNKSYQALEKAFDKQTLFSDTGGTIIEVQKSLSDITTLLDIGMKILEVASYVREFYKQDEFSLDAVKNYLGNADNGVDLPEKMKKTMVDYTDALSGSLDGFTGKRFVDNIDKWLMQGMPIRDILGTEAAIALLGWSLASKLIPYVSNGLSDADSFELALYSQLFQFDAALDASGNVNTMFDEKNDVSPERLYNITQFYYVFLKSCLITREAALDSLGNKRYLLGEQIQPLIDYQNNINSRIAEIMVELKSATASNKQLEFGFLPVDNQNYLKNHNDNTLIQWAKKSNIIPAETAEATEEDFAEFERMYDAAFDMTGAEKEVDFSSVDMNSLFEDWILNTWRYHGLYAYYGELGNTPTERMGIYLPRSAQSESEVGKFTAAPENSGEWIPWIVKNVFGRKMDYSVRGDQFYYQDGQLYLKKQYFSGTGLPPYSDREIDNCMLSDGTYEISVTKTYSDGKKTWYYHAKPAYDDEHGLRYWKLLAISRNSFAGGKQDSIGNETKETAKDYYVPDRILIQEISNSNRSNYIALSWEENSLTVKYNGENCTYSFDETGKIKNGENIDSRGDTVTHSFSYDNNRLTSLDITEQYKWTADFVTPLQSRAIINSFGKPDYLIWQGNTSYAKVNVTYSQSGKVETAVFDDSDVPIELHYYYEDNKNPGLLTKTSLKHAGYNGTMIMSYSYNENGLPDSVATTQMFDDRPVDYSASFEYDTNNNLIVCRTEHGKISSSVEFSYIKATEAQYNAFKAVSACSFNGLYPELYLPLNTYVFLPNLNAPIGPYE
ncbi:MAG: hypothetical protein K6G90_03815 [Clostridia bacterium]|nr:hypothetical protein [Clostridia bacterium]